VNKLTEETAKHTEKDKKNEQDAAKEKDKFRRLQQLAKGYRKQVADKMKEIEKVKQEMESELADQQNKNNFDLAAAKTELDSSKNELNECQAELAKLKEEHKTVQDSNNKIVANAGKKIKKLQTDLAEATGKLCTRTRKRSFSSQTFLDGVMLKRSAPETFFN